MAEQVAANLKAKEGMVKVRVVEMDSKGGLFFELKWISWRRVLDLNIEVENTEVELFSSSFPQVENLTRAGDSLRHQSLVVVASMLQTRDQVTKVGLPATLVRDLETLLDGHRSKFTSAFAVKASL